LPQRLERAVEPVEFHAADPPKNETEALWRNFLDCVRRRDRNTLCPPELGAAAVAVVALAQQSYRDGRAYCWDHERRCAGPADGWSERRTHRGEPGASATG
jgi:hypothetical protein